MDQNEFELRQKIQETELSLYTANQRVQVLTSENAHLKQTIENMALQEANTHKRNRLSQQVIARWRYYHANKEKIKADNKIDGDWRHVKHLSDLEYQKQYKDN
jgi:hypothetical protein